MPLKVVVELQVHARQSAIRNVKDTLPLAGSAEEWNDCLHDCYSTTVTCPGVYLMEKNDLYLHASILGQCKETNCRPPIFPLLFRERLWFEKVFEKASDPVTVVELLEKNVTKFQLTELLSEEEDIAVYEENTRDFLFPEPKLIPTYAGVERELLMRTNSSFPGIAPKLEFSTRTTITQLPLPSRRSYSERNKIRVRRASSASPQRRNMSQAWTTRKNKGSRRNSRSLRSCSPSPNRTKRLSDLSEDNQQLSSSISLRSSKQKSETASRPPFVVRHVDTSKMFDQVPSTVSSRNPKENSMHRNSRPSQLKRALSVDSWKASCPTAKVIREPDEQCTCSQDSSIPETRKHINYSPVSPTCCHHSPFASPQRYRSPSPKERWASPTYRIYSSPSSNWEEINERVRNLLTSDDARQRLSNGPADFEIDDVLERRSVSLRSSPLEDRYS